MEKANIKRKVYISQEAGIELIRYLEGEGCDVCEIAKSEFVYEGVSSHPDIYMCKLGTGPEAPVYHGNPEKLGYRYPENIRYNAVVCGPFFIHNLKYTDEELLQAAEEYIMRKYGDSKASCAETDPADEHNDGFMQKIHVPQGYAKCNMVAVDDTHIITEDAGVAKAIEMAMWRKRNSIGRGRGEERKREQESFETERLKVLLISPKQVALPGFPHGFIGGASGRVGDTMIFNGDITKHSDYEKIRPFIEETGLSIKYFNYPLTDIGSIIEERSDK